MLYATIRKLMKIFSVSLKIINMNTENNLPSEQQLSKQRNDGKISEKDRQNQFISREI